MFTYWWNAFTYFPTLLIFLISCNCKVRIAITVNLHRATNLISRRPKSLWVVAISQEKPEISLSTSRFFYGARFKKTIPAKNQLGIGSIWTKVSLLFDHQPIALNNRNHTFASILLLYYIVLRILSSWKLSRGTLL